VAGPWGQKWTGMPNNVGDTALVPRSVNNRDLPHSSTALLLMVPTPITPRRKFPWAEMAQGREPAQVGRAPIIHASNDGTALR
jgi:hypothetical protein